MAVGETVSHARAFLILEILAIESRSALEKARQSLSFAGANAFAVFRFVVKEGAVLPYRPRHAPGVLAARDGGFLNALLFGFSKPVSHTPAQGFLWSAPGPRCAGSGVGHPVWV